MRFFRKEEEKITMERRINIVYLRVLKLLFKINFSSPNIHTRHTYMHTHIKCDFVYIYIFLFITLTIFLPCCKQKKNLKQMSLLSFWSPIEEAFMNEIDEREKRKKIYPN